MLMNKNDKKRGEMKVKSGVFMQSLIAVICMAVSAAVDSALGRHKVAEAV